MSAATVSGFEAPAPVGLPKQGASWMAGLISALINSRAIGAVVIKELFRRKDFYALFVLTALITLILGSVNFFEEAHIVRYLQEICLFLIWTGSLVIAITTAARPIPAESESPPIFPLPA